MVGGSQCGITHHHRLGASDEAIAGGRRPTAAQEDRAMSEEERPVAVVAAEVSARTKRSAYPEPFASRMAGPLKPRWVTSRLPG